VICLKLNKSCKKTRLTVCYNARFLIGSSNYLGPMVDDCNNSRLNFCANGWHVLNFNIGRIFCNCSLYPVRRTIHVLWKTLIPSMLVLNSKNTRLVNCCFFFIQPPAHILQKPLLVYPKKFALFYTCCILMYFLNFSNTNLLWTSSH
jgi:hypothetical protein